MFQSMFGFFNFREFLLDFVSFSTLGHLDFPLIRCDSQLPDCDGILCISRSLFFCRYWKSISHQIEVFLSSYSIASVHCRSSARLLFQSLHAVNPIIQRRFCFCFASSPHERIRASIQALAPKRQCCCLFPHRSSTRYTIIYHPTVFFTSDLDLHQ
jgi:hypothetical protein